MLAFLDQERVLTVATIGRDGWPHLMPLWFVVRDGECWGWTYGKSQKVRNLERDPRCTLQVEAGRPTASCAGVMIKARPRSCGTLDRRRDRQCAVIALRRRVAVDLGWLRSA